MKLNLFLLIIIGSLFVACGHKTTEPPKEEPKVAPKEEPKNDMTANEGKAPECYRYLNNKDTIYLQISEAYNMITGLLLYKYYQKDKNLGTIQGKMVGDVLVADYTFRAEGRVSSRQIAFKKKGDDFVEGYGDVKDVNGKMVFKDVNTLKYNDSMVLRKVPCKQ